MKSALLALEKLFDDTLTPRCNPLYSLGAIAVFFMWLLFISGLYLFIFYKMNSPYESVRLITEEQWYIGTAIRGIHRYSADGLIIFTLLHLIRQLIKGRFRHWRWLAWGSGIVTLGVIWTTGIIGYWMVWDERAQMIAELTSKLLDYIPIFGESLSMAFTTADLVTNLFFFIALFLHLTLPVLLFIMIWIHVLRISKPVINPPRLLGIAVVLAVFFVSAVKPATSLLAADTERMVTVIGIDWFYMFIYPLLNATPPWASLLIMITVTSALVLLPWIMPQKRPERAEIISENCTGCEQCHEDCPYAAIFLKPKSESSDELEAKVIPQRCASCGICVGSCSFDAVSFPLKTEDNVRMEIKELLKGAGAGQILCIMCSCIDGAEKVADSDNGTVAGVSGVRVLTLPCAGMVQPSWIEHALESGADGVMIWGCSHGDCNYRLGNRWMHERLVGKRRPVLGHSAAGRVLPYWSSSTRPEDLLEALKTFRENIRSKGGL